MQKIGLVRLSIIWSAATCAPLCHSETATYQVVNRARTCNKAGGQVAALPKILHIRSIQLIPSIHIELAPFDAFRAASLYIDNHPLTL
jgi:hypothetical protein